MALPLETSYILVLSQHMIYRSPNSGARATTIVTYITNFVDRGVDMSSKMDEYVVEYAIEPRYGLLVVTTTIVEVRY